MRIIQAVTVVALGALAMGCARMVVMNYEPSNPWKGHGALTVLPFRYEAAESNRVRPREVETNRASRSDLLLSQEITSFFTGALQRELVHSGYTKGSPALSLFRGHQTLLCRLE